MALQDNTRPLSSVLSQIISEVAYLVQTEIRLARAEMSEKFGKMASAGTMIGAGALLLLAGFIVLLFAIVRWLAVAGIPEEWGFLIVGGIIAVVGLALAMAGSSSLKHADLTPDKTVAQMRADYSVIKEQVK